MKLNSALGNVDAKWKRSMIPICFKKEKERGALIGLYNMNLEILERLGIERRWEDWRRRREGIREEQWRDRENLSA